MRIAAVGAGQISASLYGLSMGTAFNGRFGSEPTIFLMPYTVRAGREIMNATGL